jgi:hypothetical protein
VGRKLDQLVCSRSLNFGYFNCKSRQVCTQQICVFSTSSKHSYRFYPDRSMIKTITPYLALSISTSTITSLSLFIDPNSAQAVTIQFNDLASFQANTAGLTTIDFEGLAPIGSFTTYPSGGLTTQGVNFTGSSGLYVIDPAFSQPFYNWGSGATLSAQSAQQGSQSIAVNLPSGVTAVGGDIMSFINYASPFTISLSTGETFNLSSLNYPNRQFVGFTSDTAIASISFLATGGVTQLDNFRFGTANNTTSVPEPFTIIGTLIGGTSALRIRKKLKLANQ